MLELFNLKKLNVFANEKSININIDNNDKINYIEIKKNKNTSIIINLLNKIIIKNKINIQHVHIIIINTNTFNLTENKIILTMCKTLSLAFKLPLIKIENEVLLNHSLLNKKKYKIIILNIDKNEINLIVYKTYIISKTNIKKKNLRIKKKYIKLNLYIKNKISNSKIYIIKKKNALIKKKTNSLKMPSIILPTYVKKQNYFKYNTNEKTINKQK